MLLTIINPPTEETNRPPPGNLIAEITWDKDCAADVDLWVRDPAGQAVGYSAPWSKAMNLLRDDLGHVNDISQINHEIQYSRGLVPGEYVVNIHLYRTNQCELPLTVNARVWMKTKATTLKVWEGSRKLHRMGHELTLTRLRLDKEGNLVSDSLNDVPVSFVYGASAAPL